MFIGLLEEMGLFSFWKKKDLSEERVETVVEKEEAQKLHDPYHSAEVRSLLANVPRDMQHLKLEQIERNAETIVNYLRALTKDLSSYANTKDEASHEKYKQMISTKMKMITQRGLELRNLIGLLESHHYQVLLDLLEKVHAQTQDDFLLSLKKRLLEDLQVEKDVEANLMKIIAYDELLNGEKNPNVGAEIAKVAQTREINQDMNRLVALINTDILDKKDGMLARIRQEKILEALRIKSTV